jgi:hypothetical protein
VSYIDGLRTVKETMFHIQIWVYCAWTV